MEKETTESKQCKFCHFFWNNKNKCLKGEQRAFSDWIGCENFKPNEFMR